MPEHEHPHWTVTVALVGSYPSEAAARAAITADSGSEPTSEYRGLWTMPTPDQPLVHLFTDVRPEELTGMGWILEASVPPGPADTTWTDDDLERIRERARRRAAEFARFVD